MHDEFDPEMMMDEDLNNKPTGENDEDDVDGADDDEGEEELDPDLTSGDDEE